jgi:hypothetical protein
MALLEIAIAIVLFAAFIKEVRTARRHAAKPHGSHPGVGWFDLAAGALLIFEAFHGAHHGKPGYLRPQFLSGLVAIALGVFHSRIHHLHQRRRYLKVDDTGLEFRLPPFRKVSAQWSDVASVDLGPSHATLHLHDGSRRKIALGRFRNSDELRRGIADHAGPAGLLPE